MSTLTKIRDSFRNLTSTWNLTRQAESILIGFIIILVAFGSFGLGRLSKTREERHSVSLMQVGTTTSAALSGGVNIKKATTSALFNPQGDGIPSTAPGGFIGASKSGKKYHFPWCVGAKQIKEENKVWFASEDEARAAGFSPAANCKGLSE